MHYPNLRYGNPTELEFYAQGVPVKDLARRLRRSERSVRDWLNQRKRVPWWVPEVLRLQHMEMQQQLYRMGITQVRNRLGMVNGEVIKFPPPQDKTSSQQQAASALSESSAFYKSAS